MSISPTDLSSLSCLKFIGMDVAAVIEISRHWGKWCSAFALKAGMEKQGTGFTFI